MYKNSTLSFGLIAEFFLGTWTVASCSFGYPDGILSYVRLRAYRICALGELRRRGLWYVPYCDGGAGALS